MTHVYVVLKMQSVETVNVHVPQNILKATHIQIKAVVLNVYMTMIVNTQNLASEINVLILALAYVVNRHDAKYLTI
jgi:hypothetical protein